MAKKLTKIPDGLKSKGARVPVSPKMGNEESGSAKKAPAEQMQGKEAKKLKKEN